MKRTYIFLLIIGLMLFATACTKPAVKEQPKPLAKVGLILPPYDAYFYNLNEIAKKGIQDIQRDYNVEVEIKKINEAVYETEDAIAFAKDKDLVIFMSYPLNDAFSELQTQYPDKQIIGVETYINGNDYEEAPNGAGYFAKEEQGGFLAGILAAKLTTNPNFEDMNKEKKVGFIGAILTPFLNRDLGGFQQGVWTIDKEIQVEEVWGPETQDAFDNPEWAYQEAEKLYEKGVDIIFAVGGKTAEGVYRAAKDNGKYAISMDTNKGYLAPGHVLAGINRRIDLLVYYEIKEYLENVKLKNKGIIKKVPLKSGAYKVGLEEGIIEISDIVGMSEEEQWLKAGKITQQQFNAIKAMKKNMPQDCLDSLAFYKESILNGGTLVRENSGPLVNVTIVKQSAESQ